MNVIAVLIGDLLTLLIMLFCVMLVFNVCVSYNNNSNNDNGSWFSIVIAKLYNLTFGLINIMIAYVCRINIAIAIGKSKTAPSFFVSAGERFIVIFP